MEFATNAKSKALCVLTICLVAPFTSGPLFWLQCSLNSASNSGCVGTDACFAKTVRHETQSLKAPEGLQAETPHVAVPTQSVEEPTQKGKQNDEFEKHARKVADESSKSADDDDSYKRGHEYRMLTEIVTHLKSGSLVKGTQCLRQLTQKYPDNDDYQRLLDLAEGRLKTEMWYRFQRRDLSSRKKESMWIENDDAQLTRLKHSTWLLLSKNSKRVNPQTNQER